MEEVEKCVNCGFCESVCPTFPASGYISSFGARGRVDLGKYLIKESLKKNPVDLNIADSFYSCLSCNACVVVCPAGVNAGKVSLIARKVITEGNYVSRSNEQPVAKMIVNSIMKYYNPLGLRKKCSKWAKDLEFDSRSETILYTGNMFQLMPYSKSLASIKKKVGKRNTDRFARLLASWPLLIKLASNLYDRDLAIRMEKSLKGIVMLLKKSGVSFGYLREDEPYPGTFLFELGYEQEFREYANKVYGMFKSRGIKQVITVDPHTYDIMKNEYPKVIKEFNIKVLHYLELVKTDIFRKTEETITYHEPCHFSRSETPFNSPVELLANLSDLRMPAFNGRATYCCGGPDDLIYTDLANSVSDARSEQLRATGASKVITSCPICFTNLNKYSSVAELSEFLEGLLI